MGGRPSVWTDEMDREGRRLVAAGLTVRQVASRLGVSKSSVSGRADREGWPRPKTQLSRSAGPKRSVFDLRRSDLLGGD